MKGLADCRRIHFNQPSALNSAISNRKKEKTAPFRIH